VTAHDGLKFDFRHNVVRTGFQEPYEFTVAGAMLDVFRLDNCGGTVTRSEQHAPSGSGPKFSWRNENAKIGVGPFVIADQARKGHAVKDLIARHKKHSSVTVDVRQRLQATTGCVASAIGIRLKYEDRIAKLPSHRLDNLASEVTDNDDVSHDPQSVVRIQSPMNRRDSPDLEANFVDDVIPHPAAFPGGENDGIDWCVAHGSLGGE